MKNTEITMHFIFFKSALDGKQTQNWLSGAHPDLFYVRTLHSLTLLPQLIGRKNITQNFCLCEDSSEVPILETFK